MIYSLGKRMATINKIQSKTKRRVYKDYGYDYERKAKDNVLFAILQSRVPTRKLARYYCAYLPRSPDYRSDCQCGYQPLEKHTHNKNKAPH